jgi:hypothetical protein
MPWARFRPSAASAKQAERSEAMGRPAPVSPEVGLPPCRAAAQLRVMQATHTAFGSGPASSTTTPTPPSR